MTRSRLGIVVTHPIQYQVPLYRYLAARTSVEPVVLFLSEHGLTESFDREFGRSLKFDIQFTGGYEYEMVRNRSIKPHVSTPWGVFNPALPRVIKRSRLDVIHGARLQQPLPLAGLRHRCMLRYSLHAARGLAARQKVSAHL